MSGCRRARNKKSGRMHLGPRTRLPVGTNALGFFFVLCWLYVFSVYHLPGEKEIMCGMRLQQKCKAWQRGHHAAHAFSVNAAIAKPCSFKPWLLATWGILCSEVLHSSE
uniref:Uncharacterized protein n=1 Tax=Anolis carolinensis TaxID=28377 RepID=A0A803T4E2_ANOCA